MQRRLMLAFEDSSDDEDVVIRRPRWIREREDHFNNLDDVDFFTRFRLTKQTVLSVLIQIENSLEFTSDR